MRPVRICMQLDRMSWGEAMVRYLAQISKLVDGGTILELGSGPGRDAEYLESLGVSVARTDGALAFVEMMRAEGFTAEVLDMRTGQFNGTYDAVVANAVLLHLRRDATSSNSSRESREV